MIIGDSHDGDVMLFVGSGDAPDSESSAEPLFIVAADDNADAKPEAPDADVMDSCSKAGADDDATAVSDTAADTGKTKHAYSGGSSLALGLSTGHFDVADVKLLRTCSEPNLSCLSPQQFTPLKAYKSLHTRSIDSHSHDSLRDSLNVGVVSHQVCLLLHYFCISYFLCFVVSNRA